MSKSKLTGIAPQQITDVFGSDAFRYYFLRAIAFGQDGSFCWEDLVGPLPGRARQRLRQPRVARHRDGRRGTSRASCRAPGEYTDADLAIQKTVQDAAAAADAAIERFAIHEAIAAIWTIVDELNGYITEQEPWVLAKDDGEPRAPRRPCSTRRPRVCARSPCCSAR